MIPYEREEREVITTTETPMEMEFALLSEWEPFSIPGKETRSHGKRRISFSLLESVCPTIQRRDYSPEEKAATWYNIEDMKLFRKERREVVHMIEQGVNMGHICCRGVECLTKSGAKKRQNAILRGQLAVFDEQELQQLDGSQNPEVLAQIYKHHTKSSRAEAYGRGLKDEKNIMDSRPTMGACPVSPPITPSFSPSFFRLFEVNDTLVMI